MTLLTSHFFLAFAGFIQMQILLSKVQMLGVLKLYQNEEMIIPIFNID